MYEAIIYTRNKSKMIHAGTWDECIAALIEAYQNGHPKNAQTEIKALPYQHIITGRECELQMIGSQRYGDDAWQQDAI